MKKEDISPSAAASSLLFFSRACEKRGGVFIIFQHLEKREKNNKKYVRSNYFVTLARLINFSSAAMSKHMYVHTFVY
jgi:hypothetical protein